MIDTARLFRQDEMDAAIGKRLARHRLHRTDQAKATVAAAEDVKQASLTATAQKAWAAEREAPPGYPGDAPTPIPQTDAAHPCSSRDRDDIPFLGEAA